MKTEYARIENLGGRRNKIVASVSDPINYKLDYSDAQEEWKVMNLTPRQQGANHVVDEAPYVVTFNNGVSLDYVGRKSGHTYNISLDGAANKPALPLPRGIEWKDVAPGVDARVALKGRGMFLLLQLNNANAQKTFRWVFTSSDAASLDAVDQTVNGVDANGKHLRLTSTWTRVDANTLHCDIEFLDEVKVRNRDRVASYSDQVAYPVVIDPIVTETITASADDGWQSDSTAWSSGTNDLYVENYTYGDYTVGFRFTTIAVPQGATINSADLNLDVGTLNTQPTGDTLVADDVDDAPAFTASDTPRGITPTTASVSITGGISVGINTFDVTAIVQEIVNRGGWASGNDMRFTIQHAASTSGSWWINSTDSAGTDPELEIDYTEGGGQNSAFLQFM